MKTVERWERKYDELRAYISDLVVAKNLRGQSRGRRRREWRLSYDRLAALQRQTRLEVTLERTMLWILHNELQQAAWFNQFNPASGAGGESTEAVDLIRWESFGHRARKDLLELKEWDANDTIAEMVDEVIRYAMLTTILHELRVSPYADWPPMLELHLWCIAPHTFFSNQGGFDVVNHELERLSGQWSNLQRQRPALQNVALQTTAICLPASISKRGFCDCFDSVAVEAAVQSKHSAPNPGVLLRADCIADLKDWIGAAMNEAGLLN